MEKLTSSELLEKFAVPFKDDKGELDFPIEAQNGIVYIWPLPPPKTTGTLFIPEQLRETFKTNYGLILSSGPGCIDAKTREFMASTYNPLDVVLFDKNTPWTVDIKDNQGKEHKVSMMNIADVYGKVKKHNF